MKIQRFALEKDKEVLNEYVTRGGKSSRIFVSGNKYYENRFEMEQDKDNTDKYFSILENVVKIKYDLLSKNFKNNKTKKQK